MTSLLREHLSGNKYWSSDHVIRKFDIVL